MGAPVPIGDDIPAEERRRLARLEVNGRVACRLLALANALDGMSRERAARQAGMDRRTLRDWVLRFNAEGVVPSAPSRIARASSGSTCSMSESEPLRSPSSTVTSLRSPSSAARKSRNRRARCPGVWTAGGATKLEREPTAHDGAAAPMLGDLAGPAMAEHLDVLRLNRNMLKIEAGRISANESLSRFMPHPIKRDPRPLRIAVAGRRHGPYHHARFAAASAHCDLTVVEFSRRDNVNSWDYITETRGFHQVTLFTDDVDVDDRPVAEVKRAVQRTLQEIDPTAVAIPGWSHPGALACLQWCLRQRRPGILMSESTAYDEPRVWWREAVKRRVVRLFTAALVGGAAHRGYARSLGLPEDAICCGYDAVDNAHFAESAARTRADAPELRRAHLLPERFFLAASRFVEKKNLFRLLEAFALYRRNAEGAPWSIVLLGDGALRPMIEDHVRRLGVDRHVLLPGFKQHDELPLYYGLASAFVHASTSEPWGLVVNEAMASGLPVLVSERCGCAPDLVRAGVNGYTFDPYDVERLAGLMLRVGGMTDARRAALAREGQRIVAEWGLARFADGFIKASEAAVGRKPPGGGWLDHLTLEVLMRR